MSWFCKHDWEVLDKTVLESPFEQIMAADFPEHIPEMKGCKGAGLYRKKALIVLCCKKCGKLRESKVTNPCEWILRRGYE